MLTKKSQTNWVAVWAAGGLFFGTWASWWGIAAWTVGFYMGWACERDR